MYYDAVIFDLDGTLLDTLGDLCSAVNYALSENGLPGRSLDEIRRFVGNGIFNLVKRAVPDGADEAVTERVFSVFKAYYAKHSNDTTAPYPGVEELVLRLKNEGVALGVVSNKAQFAVDTIMETYFPHMFTAAFGEREGVPRKPDPAGVLEMARILGGKRFLYVGDSEVDVETARNSAMDGVFVTWGFRSRAEMAEAGAELFACDTHQLYRYIQEGPDAYSAD